MERIRIVAAEEHGRRTNYLVHELLQRRPPVFSSDHCDSKLYLVQLADVSVLVRKLPYRRWPDHDQSEWHGWLGSKTQGQRSLVRHARSNRLRGHRKNGRQGSGGLARDFGRQARGHHLGARLRPEGHPQRTIFEDHPGQGDHDQPSDFRDLWPSCGRVHGYHDEKPHTSSPDCRKRKGAPSFLLRSPGEVGCLSARTAHRPPAKLPHFPTPTFISLSRF